MIMIELRVPCKEGLSCKCWVWWNEGTSAVGTFVTEIAIELQVKEAPYVGKVL